MNLSNSDKDEFNKWFLETLSDTDVKAAITARGVAKGITFDTDGHITLLTAKQTAQAGKAGAVTAAEDAKQNAVKAENVARDDFYSESSSSVDALSGFMGKDDKLSKLLHEKRSSFTHASPKPKTNPA